MRSRSRLFLPILAALSLVAGCERTPVEIDDDEVVEPPKPALGLAYVIRDPFRHAIMFAPSDGSPHVTLAQFQFEYQTLDYSPDGARLAFGGRNSNVTNIYVMNADGGEALPLTTATMEGEAYLYPSWSPDGYHIAYVYASNHDRSRGETGPYSLWVMNADGTGKRQIHSGAGNTTVDWSPDGRRILLGRSYAVGGLGVFRMIDVESGIETTIPLPTPSPNDLSGWTCGSPSCGYFGFSFTSDGRLLVLGLENGNFGNLFFLDADGTDLTRITTTGGYLYAAAAPDLRQFAAEQWVRTGVKPLHVIDADGSVTAEIPGGLAPAWRPQP